MPGVARLVAPDLHTPGALEGVDPFKVIEDIVVARGLIPERKQVLRSIHVQRNTRRTHDSDFSPGCDPCVPVSLEAAWTKPTRDHVGRRSDQDIRSHAIA